MFTDQTEATKSSKPWKSPTSKLYAIADLHLAYTENKTAWSKLSPHPNDGLILCGDIGESPEHLHLAFSLATRNFDTVWWCPGNHELYTIPSSKSTSDPGGVGLRGEEKYMQCVEIAQGYGVKTPEDEFVVWDGEGGRCVVAMCFTLYDYSFRPEGVSEEGAVAWAREKDTEATDEFLLYPDPYVSRREWCHKLVEKFEEKLDDAKAGYPGLPFVIANHWPLREDLVTLKYIPRFSLWCGTKLTDDWHKRFNAKVVVSGHLHIRRTDWRNGCRFEEVSLGYPRHWKKCAEVGKGVNDILREILPGPEVPEGEVETHWRIYG